MENGGKRNRPRCSSYFLPLLNTKKRIFINFDEGNNNTLSAFSLSLGIALDFEGIEVGLFLGKDFLPGSAGDR